MTRVIVVGSANIDLIAQVDHLPLPGETVLGREVTQRPGGKGANQAVAASRLGADTIMFAAVGRDAFGEAVIAALHAQGVSARIARVAQATTGIAMVTVAANGENSIVVASGANHRLNPATVDGELADACRPGDVLVLQLEVPTGTCLAAARTARTRGASVVLNAAPPPRSGDPVILDLLRHVDVLILNEREAQQLARHAQVPAGEGWPGMADGLRKLGPATVVITLGEQGAVAASPCGVHRQLAYRVEVVDTTGAGDAFCGAFAAAYAQGRELAEALTRGCAAGALASTALGAQSAMPGESDLDRLLRTVS